MLHVTLVDNVGNLGLGQVGNLGLGQVDAPTTIVWDLEDNKNHEDLDGVAEKNVRGGIAADESGLFFSGDHFNLVD